MDFLTTIHWHQGQFLQPQHFQRQDLHNQAALEPLFGMASPHSWGVGELEFAPDSLAAQHLDIRAAQLLFKPSTYVKFPGNAIITPRSFGTVWTDPEQPLEVFLGIRKLSLAGSNVSVVDSFSQAMDIPTRFATEANGQEMPDIYGAGPSANIPELKIAVRIIFGPELALMDEYDLIPIGVLERVSDSVQFSSERTPPCYFIAGSQILIDSLRDLRDEVSGRMHQLAEYKVPQEMHEKDLDARFFLLMQALQALNRMVPSLSHLIEARQVHPWAVYGLLRAFVGELSTFTDLYDASGRRRESPTDAGLPPYDHQNQYACFQAATALISRLLAEISAGPEFRITLQPQDSYLVATIERDLFTSRNRFYLMLSSASKWDDSGREFQQTARLAAPMNLPKLIDHALPGNELLELQNPPQGMPKRANTKYFRIEQLSDEWEQIAQTAAIGLYWPGAPADLRAQIIVLRG